MNPGGEPERDDTGLPPVDIEIPDDARELDRDVQAYYREQRARRRQQRGHRLHGPLTKDGIVLPLLACCLILALITGTLLTVFTATSDPTVPTTPASGGRAATSSASSGRASAPGSVTPHADVTPTPNVVPGTVPQATLAVDQQGPTPVQSLHRAALILVPPQCNCTATVSWLIGVVTGAKAQPYLIYTASTQTAVDELYGRLSSGQRAETTMALDPGGLLTGSVPGSLPTGGLTAILLGPTKVAYATAFSTRDDPTTLLHSLTR